MSIHVWYSGATDVTGKALAEALVGKGINTSHGLTIPRSKPDLLLCYGCKHGDRWNPSQISGWNVLNNPVNIRHNANKFASLNKLKDADIAVALPIIEASSIERSLDRDGISLPIVGRKKFHQGGKGFWLCLQRDDVKKAVADGAQYFQPYVPKGEEYRVHVFGGNHLFTVKKVRRADPYDDWRADRKEAITAKASERGVTIHDATLALALEYAPKRMKLPDTAIRSVHRGWVFKSVSRPRSEITDLAKKTAEILELDLAAVDIMIGDDGTAYVLEANSGPGLKGQNIDKYVTAIEAKHSEVAETARRSASSRGSAGSARPTTDRRRAQPARRASRESSEGEEDSSLSSSVRGLLRGVNVDDLDDEGKRAVRSVISNVLDSELGL